MSKKLKSPFWYFFTLFSFVAGVILYIFLKRKNRTKIDVVKEVKKDESIPSDFSNREEIIMQAMRKNVEVEPSEIYKLLPDVTTRTIRRDLTKLVGKGFIKQMGSTKSTSYKYIKG